MRYPIHKFLLWFIYLSLTLNAQGQQITPTSQESEITLSVDQFISLLIKYHPIAKQADIQIDQAKQEVRIARGAFDPTFSYKTAEKTFDGTSYYVHQQPVITVPTWFGVNIQSGWERVDGNRVDPTETLGRSSYLGVQIPIGRDLLTDKRRTDLQKAKIIREASSIEKRKIINDLILEATNSYWEWWLQNRILLITAEALSVTKKRFDFVKLSVRGGDRPAIDTIEAFAQVQLFELLYNQAKVLQQKSQWELSQYIWQENQTPYLLPENCMPALNQFEQFIATQNLPNLDSMLSTAKSNHPELLLYNFKLSSLEIEKKYRTQQLLPKATFNYNFLDKGFQWTTPKTTIFENNYQYGISLNIPLRLSAERGEYKKVKYSIQSTTLEQDLKRLQIENKIKAIYFEIENLKQQLLVQQNILSNYQTLLRGEELRFRTGESSLFLVNARESKVWETAQKFEELKAKYVSAIQKLRWSAGQLN
ncbi:MAG: TolC family protein [Chitinophagaceae bacterium]